MLKVAPEKVGDCPDFIGGRGKILRYRCGWMLKSISLLVHPGTKGAGISK
jgi:hypothetical protein